MCVHMFSDVLQYAGVSISAKLLAKLLLQFGVVAMVRMHAYSSCV